MLTCISTVQACWLTLGRGICPKKKVKSGSCEMLSCMSIAQACTKCVSAFWADSGARFFKILLIVNFYIKWLVRKC